MKLRKYKYLADENINPDVISFLREQFIDVISVSEIGLTGADDNSVIRKACKDDRVILTHDSDFGTLALLRGEPVKGIIYLRPGHINSFFTIDTVKALFDNITDADPPFIIVAEKREKNIKIRIRHL